MLNQVLLNETLQKINASLNKRFEKDANLYISKQDEYEIKKHICNNAFKAVVDMINGKNINPEIVIKIFIRNAGIISINKSNKSAFEKEMKPILESVQYKSVKYMMEDILSNNVYLNKTLKHILFKYYMNQITTSERLDYWESTEYKFDSEERKILFYSIIKNTKHPDPQNQLPYLLNFIRNSLEKYNDLLIDNKIYLKLKETCSEEDKNKLFDFLCKEMYSPSIDSKAYNHIIEKAYESYSNLAFNDAINKIKDSSPRLYKNYINVIYYLLINEKDVDTATKIFDTIVRTYESLYIKNHIKVRIDQKIWKAAKINENLYSERHEKIDILIANSNQEDKKKYKMFNDILYDIEKGELSEESIAYFWVNMNKEPFINSLIESFNYLPNNNISYDYEYVIKGIYYYIFRHALGKNTKTLEKVCDYFAYAILQYGKITGVAKKPDELLLNYILNYKFKGDNIKSYLANYHFKEYQNNYI